MWNKLKVRVNRPLKTNERKKQKTLGKKWTKDSTTREPKEEEVTSEESETEFDNSVNL